jgi:archaellum component FlaC
MQQLEDLSKIIRDKDGVIDNLNNTIKDLQDENRDLHNTIIKVREEAAAISQIKGTEMLLQSSMKDKMLNDPRYRKLVEKQKADNL